MEIYVSIMDLLYGKDWCLNGRFPSWLKILDFFDENVSSEEFKIFSSALGKAEKMIKENGFEYISFPISDGGKSRYDFYVHILK